MSTAALAQSVQDVLTLVQENPVIPRDRLSPFFQAALGEGLLTASQALELLAAVGWQGLGPESEVGFVVHALELALMALGSGISYEDVLRALTQALEEGVMGPLVTTKVTPALPELVRAMVRARTQNIEQILARVMERVREGVPLRALGPLMYRLCTSQISSEEFCGAIEQLPTMAGKGPPQSLTTRKHGQGFRAGECSRTRTAPSSGTN